MNLFSTQWAHHVESTSIRRGYYFDRSRVKFRRISTSFSRTFFRCNFDGRKIQDVSTCYFRRNFAGRKIHVVSTYSFRCNLDGWKIHVVSTYFYRLEFGTFYTFNVWSSEYAEHFHISHFTNHLRHFIIIDHK